MPSPKKSPRHSRFGPFSVDLSSGELWREGIRIRLQVQPFEILRVFLERPNELITREELQNKIWPSDTFVDFERGLNKAINKLRDALCDTAENSHYIETVPKRGYRFRAQVETDPATTSVPEIAKPPVPSEQVLTSEFPTKRSFAMKHWMLSVLLLVSLFAVLFVAVRKRPSTEGANSIAVLPLLTQGTDAEYDISDGLTDSIINDLSLVPKLRVISHASVFQYRGQAVDPRAVGQKLGVAAVLTGHVEQADKSMVLTLELTSTADSRHLWGQRYERNISERTSLTQEAASAVADALRLNINPVRRQQMGSQTSSDAEAQQLYLKGRYYFFRETPEDVLRARSLFQSAIDRDPVYALAYAGLGDSYDWMATEGYQPASEVMPQSVAAKTRANELNDSSAEIHSSLASLEFVQWNWAKAEIEFQKALMLNPNYFEAHRLYSIYLRTMKRYPEAIQHAKQCDELNPLLMPTKSHLALTYYYARQYDDAAEQYRLLIKDSPEMESAHAGLAAVLLRLGKEKEGIREWQKALELVGDDDAAKEMGRDYAIGGLRAAQNGILKSELRALERLAKQGYVSPLEFAYRFSLLDDKENAFRWLEKAYVERAPQLFNINVDPDYDGLRSDPRFGDLIGRLHLPQ
jgi:TolB-like protein/DNA-binding winged helix-turn-helix (wHTH) protein/Flp pilus assembly protein TadD